MRCLRNARRRSLLVLITAVGLVAGATPADAATGAGGGTVTIPLHDHGGASGRCAQLHQHTWTGPYAGNYSDPTSGASYTGPLAASVDVTAYEDPFGTHARSDCTDTPGAAVPITSAYANSTSPDPVTGWSVSCSWSSGTYSRVGTAYVYDLKNGNCTFSKAGAQVASTTWEKRVGEQVLCSGAMPPTSCTVGFTYEAKNTGP